MRSMVLMTALLATGCSAQAARDPVPVVAAISAAPAAAAPTLAHLDGTSWHFIDVGGAAVPAGVTATLRFHAGRASGNAGCNAYGASYEISADGSVKFGGAMSTKMACLQPAGAMETERGVFAALQHAVKMALQDGRLVVLDAGGRPLAKLVRSEAE